MNPPRRYLLVTLLACVSALAQPTSLVVPVSQAQGGAFTNQTLADINNNFTFLGNDKVCWKAGTGTPGAISGATRGCFYLDIPNSNSWQCFAAVGTICTGVGTNNWVQVNGGGGGSGITQLTGDGTAGPGSGSQTLTLSTVNVASGACSACSIVTNEKGLVTSQTPNASLVKFIQSNTYSPGSVQLFLPSGLTAAIRVGCSALPANPALGDWICDASDGNKPKWRTDAGWVSPGSANIAATTHLIKGDNAGNGVAANAATVVGEFTGTPTGTKFLRDDGTLAVPSGSGNLADPGADGPIKRTALNVTAPALAADITALYTGCSGVLLLGADGNCHASPTGVSVTTKGDVQGYSSTAARIPVGSNGQVLTADSAQTLGLKWATPTATGSPYCSALLTNVAGLITTPTTCTFKVQGNTSPFACAAANTIDVSASGSGTVDIFADLPATCYTNYALSGTAPTCGIGATCTAATGAPSSPTAHWIAHFVVTAGAAVMTAKDGDGLMAIEFPGYNETQGSSGQRVLNYDTHVTRVRTVAGASDSITSADCYGIVRYTSATAVAVTVPQAGTSSMANGCWWSSVAAGAGTVTNSTTTSVWSPTGKNVVSGGTSSRFTSNGTDYIVEPGAGTSGGTTTGQYTTFNTPGSVSFTCPTSGNYRAWAWGAGGSGGGGYFVGGHGGPGGGYSEAPLCTCSPGATVSGTVGGGGTWSSGEIGVSGGDSSIASCVYAVGGGWVSAASQTPGYNKNNTPDVRGLFYNQYTIGSDTVVRNYNFMIVNLPDATTVSSPVSADLGGIGTAYNGSVGSIGFRGNPAFWAGAGGGGGSNSTVTHAGGAGGISWVCTAGAGGGVTSGTSTVGAAGGQPGCGGGGGGWNGTDIRGGGKGGDGRLMIQLF